MKNSSWWTLKIFCKNQASVTWEKSHIRILHFYHLKKQISYINCYMWECRTCCIGSFLTAVSHSVQGPTKTVHLARVSIIVVGMYWHSKIYYGVSCFETKLFFSVLNFSTATIMYYAEICISCPKIHPKFISSAFVKKKKGGGGFENYSEIILPFSVLHLETEVFMINQNCSVRNCRITIIYLKILLFLAFHYLSDVFLLLFSNFIYLFIFRRTIIKCNIILNWPYISRNCLITMYWF